MRPSPPSPVDAVPLRDHTGRGHATEHLEIIVYGTLQRVISVWWV